MKRENKNEKIITVYLNVSRSQDRATYEKVQKLDKARRQDFLRDAIYSRLHGIGTKRESQSPDLSVVNAKLDYLMQCISQPVPVDDLIARIDEIDNNIAYAQQTLMEAWSIG